MNSPDLLCFFGSSLCGFALKFPHQKTNEHSIDAALHDENNVGEFGALSDLQIFLSRHTVSVDCNTKDCLVVIAGFRSIEEADRARELISRVLPEVGGHPQPAGDSVRLFNPLGSQIRGLSITGCPPVDAPGQADMVWVETPGHTHQGLLLLAWLLVAVLFF